MRPPLRKIAIGVAAAAALATAALGGAAANASGSTPSTAVTGAWSSSTNSAYAPTLKGTSHFTEKGNTVTVRITDYGLTPYRAYFTVLYGNAVCDPAQAFVIGPFWTNGLGQVLNTRLTAKDTTGIVGGVVAATGGQNGNPLGSISTRIGDTDALGNPTDQDMDGLTGATDVVAIPGQPAIGLVQCDSMPVAA